MSAIYTQCLGENAAQLAHKWCTVSCWLFLVSCFLSGCLCVLWTTDSEYTGNNWVLMSQGWQWSSSCRISCCELWGPWMDQTPEWQNLITYTERGSKHWSPAQSKLLSLGKCHTLWFNHKVSYPFNKEWQAVCCVNKGYLHFGSLALYKEGSKMQITSTSQKLIMVTH